MSWRAFVAVLAFLCLASAAETTRSFYRVDYAFYTSTDNHSSGFVIARGLIQLAQIDNGDVRPRNNGAWDRGSIATSQPDWRERFSASCAPAGVRFLTAQKRLAWFIPYDRGTYSDASDPVDRYNPFNTNPRPVDPVVQFLVIPFWLVIIATGALPFGWLVAKARREWFSDPTRCRGCGYDLRATPERCPECGRPARVARRRAAPQPDAA